MLARAIINSITLIEESMQSKVRTRFSPSPTGYLHVGGARTALFSWLFAKQHDGVFVLRIEDTDKKRSTDESEKAIIDGLKWLGMDWQEGIGIDNSPHGPYRQSERVDIYKQYANQLIVEGKAYKCYCTQEDLDKQKEEFLAKNKNTKTQFKYPGTCRALANQPEDKKYVVRFIAPTEGSIEYNDLVFGKIITPNVENYDFIIVRSDGQAMYNFGAAIDDHLMEISHVIRGREHMINTPIQIMLYNAFGWSHPQMAHLPLMLAQSGEKLSKRHGSVSVEEFKKEGYSASGLLNYLMKFGWGFKDQEVFSFTDLLEKFAVEDCKRNDGKFDAVKLKAINFEHLRSKDLVSDEQYAAYLLPILKSRGLTPNNAEVINVVSVVRDKAKTFIEAADKIEFFFHQNLKLDKNLSDKFLTSNNRMIISALSKAIQDTEWKEDTIRTAVQNWLSSQNLSLKDIGQPLRIAITGQAISPELFQTMQVLGKNIVIKRLQDL